MKRIYLPLFLLAVLICACGEDRPRTNPFDSKTDLSPDEWAPTNLQAEVLNDSEIKLTWTQEKTPISGFKLSRKTGNGSLIQIAELSANVSEYTDTGLSIDTDYTYGVKAFTDVNESNNSETTVNLYYDCLSIFMGTAVEDCSGECNGTAFENECGCVEGNTGLESDFCYGCTHPSGSNYNSNATIDDGTCFILMDFEIGDNFSGWTLDGDWSYSNGSDYNSNFSDVFSGSYCTWSYQIGAWSTTIKSSMSFTLTMGMGGSISFYYMGRNSSYGSFYFTIDSENQNLPSTYDYDSGTFEWQYIELDVDSGTHTFEWVTSCGSANYSSEFMVDFIHFQWDN